MRNIPFLLAALIFLCFGHSTSAQTVRIAEDNYPGGMKTLWTDASSDPGELTDPGSRFNGSVYAAAQFERLPGEGNRSAMKSSGIELIGYLGLNRYVVRIAENAVDAQFFRNMGIDRISQLPVDSKIDPVSLRSMQALPGGPVAIRLWNAGDLSAFTEWLEANTEVRMESVIEERSLVIIKTRGQSIDPIIAHPAVSSVGPFSEKGEHLLFSARSMNRVNALRNTSIYGEGLSGDGVNVGIWDGGLTGKHVDINGHLINIEGDFISNAINDHPTHVSGIVAGKGHKETRSSGMAPGAQLFLWDFEDDIITEMTEGISDHGLNIINSSFLLSTYNDPILETTCSFPGFYVLESSELDRMVRDNPTLTHVIANGNENPDCQGAGFWSGIPIGLQSAKNVINVGWLDINEQFYGGSSVGPTYDGRIKPEVMSKGAAVRSTSFDHTYKNLFGSSMAAPATAGSIALLYEWYFDQYGIYPDAGLIRAITCNTAFDLFFTGPDYLFGFGRINMLRALEALKDTSYVVQDISQDQVSSFTIDIGSDVSQLNVGIAWTDMEALPGMIKTLVNDIDLKVIGPDATEYFPWTLDPGIPFIAAVTGVDSINNVEQVTVMDPMPGTYTVELTGTEVPFGPQEVIATYDIMDRGLRVTNPVGGEQWFAGALEFVRWDAFGTGSNFIIDVSYDDGATWSNIGSANSVPLTPATFRNWTVKDTTTHTARIRVTSGAHSDISGPFTIMRLATVIPAACDRHASIRWNPVRDADDYIVQFLVDDEYVAVDTITDTSYVFSGLVNGEEYWATVIPRNAGQPGPRSNGVLLAPNGGDCNFTDDISAYSLYAPLGFRYAFDGGLPYSAPLEVVIKNFSGMPVSGFDVCYQRDGGMPVCEAYPGSVAANSTDTFTFSMSETFTDTLDYPFTIWTDYGMDANRENDTLETLIKVVPSYPHPLPYYTDFEEADDQTHLSRAFALDGIEEWDFYAGSPEGRLSIGRLEVLANDGYNAITLDRYTAGAAQVSEAILNLNLDGYQDSTIYLDFAFAEHLESYEAGDVISARTDTSEPWVTIFTFGNPPNNWRYTGIRAINLSRILVEENGQTFGRRFQLRFGQEGTEPATSMSEEDGRSFDNIRVYSAGKDIEVLAADAPSIYCDSVSGSIPLTVYVKNNSIIAASDITAGFISSTGQMHSENIAGLPPGDTAVLVFSQELDYTPGTLVFVDLFVDHPEDLYGLNDTLRDIGIAFQALYTPEHFEDFEAAASYVSGGQNSTWELGAPANIIIDDAASGEQAWVTSLSGRHNNQEQSFLLTPCFNLSGLSGAVNFAFNLKLEIEEDFDFLAVDYSTDGLVWTRFNPETEAYNWFNGSGDYWDVNIDEWQTASNNILPDSLADPGQVLFRFILDSDAAYKEEGAAIDDIHLTPDLGAVLPMVSGQQETEDMLPVGPGFSAWILSGEVVAAISAATGSGTTRAGVVKGPGFADIGDFRALARHFWIEADNDYVVRLYLPYDEYDDLFAEYGDWSAPSRLSVLSYSGESIDSTADNNTANYRCVENLSIRPYRNGYMFQFSHSGPGEFYFVENGPCSNAEFINAGPVTATGTDPMTGTVEWSTESEINIASFLVESGPDCLTFTSAESIPAIGSDTIETDYVFTDSSTDKECTMCYRVQAITASGDTIPVGSDTASFIFPSLIDLDSLATTVLPGDDVLLSWGTPSEKCNDRFDIMVSESGAPYALLGTVPSSGDSDTYTPYSFLDDMTAKMDTICYRIDQFFTDGSSQSFGPVCVIFSGDTIPDSMLEVTAIAVSNVLCFGDATGSIDMTISGGMPPYMVRWNTGQESEDLAGIPAGTYMATIEDAEGTIITTIPIVVGQPPQLLVTGGMPSDAICDGSATGSVTGIGVSGGVPPYGYMWNNGQNTPDLVGATAGSYQLTVTDSNACESLSTVFMIDEPLPISILQVQAGPASCPDAMDGSIDIEVGGGTMPYTYLWSNGDTTQDITGLPAGDYSCTITDANGCMLPSSIITVASPSMITITSELVLDADCAGDSTGSVLISVAGGTPPYDYAWSNGDTLQDLGSVTAGGYFVEISDANGCSIISPTYTVGSPGPIIAVIAGTENAMCNGGSDGSISLDVSGGTPMYMFAWSNGAVTEDLAGIPAGIYGVAITDNNGCTASLTGIVIEEPDALEIASTIVADNLCAGGMTGTIAIEISGGTAPYSYMWDSGDTTAELDSLAAGNYSLVVTDSNGCQLSADPISVGEPDAISLEAVTLQDVTCTGSDNGAIDISLAGGTPPFSVAWSTGDSTEDLSGLPPGDYGFTVTDANECAAQFGPYTVNEPEPLTLSDITVENVSCRNGSDGSISIRVEGGTEPYSYSWNNGAGTEDLADLPAGTYFVIVTDANDCAAGSGNLPLSQPTTDLEAQITTTPESSAGASDGSVSVSVSGGNAPYMFEWNTGDDGPSIEDIPGAEYCVTITDANGCAIEECAEVGVGTGISGLFQLTDIQLFPNPARDRAELRISFNAPVPVSIGLFDLEGRAIETWELPGDTDLVEHGFELEMLPSGTYMVRVRSGRAMLSLPLIIQR